MKILTPLYKLIDLRAAYRFLDSKLPDFFLPAVFNWFYKFSSDPFDLEKSDYEAHKFALVAKCVQEIHVKNALDIGCGTGVLTEKISHFCTHILGIDFSTEAIETAKNRCAGQSNIRFLAADIRAFQPPETYDLVLCSEVLYYVGEPDLEKFLGLLHVALSENGRLIVVDAADDGYTQSKLSQYFHLVKKSEERNWFRPFSVRVFAKIEPGQK
ncbi:Methyltransferase type 12 [Chloroherpeton thalassium ATCC 35110]|uniref:Methyltransferase type 12 n=1 Tax=Chloroherpeton thalassium (strain ATCC 35110 / GB-78) TaxID=517418 RepID=B3QTW3_CHLT3|nr:class I SAM-dependent methyltransferase [Chloroherpeton thalassium]ACF14311.1 Methyltransferase type 12 [Chloroherpeton thalassium ATCC 35110]